MMSKVIPSKKKSFAVVTLCENLLSFPQPCKQGSQIQCGRLADLRVGLSPRHRAPDEVWGTKVRGPDALKVPRQLSHRKRSLSMEAGQKRFFKLRVGEDRRGLS